MKDHHHHHPVALEDIRLGAKVQILATANVLSRMPHLVGKIGIVKSVPQHPNTWFHIAIQGEPKEATFQQTALKLLDGFAESDNYFDDGGAPPAAAATAAAQEEETNEEDDDDIFNVPVSEWPAWPDKTTTLVDTTLQQIERDSWIGQPVEIMHGIHKGKWSRVLGTGSGWIHVRLTDDKAIDPKNIKNGVEISKRATELCLIKGYVIREPRSDRAEKKQPINTTYYKRTAPATRNAGNYSEALNYYKSAYGGVSLIAKQHVMRAEDGSANVQVDDLVTVTQGIHLGKKGVVKSLNLNGYVCVQLGAGNGASQSNMGGDVKRSSKNTRVVISQTGEKGTIVRSGHGFYSVRLDSDNDVGGMTSAGEVTPPPMFASDAIEVQKRREELQFLDENDQPIVEASEEYSNSNNNRMAEDKKKRTQRTVNQLEPPAEEIIRGKRERKPARRSRYEEEEEKKDSIKNSEDEEEENESTLFSRIGGIVDANSFIYNSHLANMPLKEQIRIRRRIAIHNRKRIRAGDDSFAKTKLEATQHMRQENIMRWFSYAKDRLEHAVIGTAVANSRPNLQEWLEKIQGEDEEDEDTYVPLLIDLAYCNTCFLEKEHTNDFCWNPACWESPVYTPGEAPLSDAIPNKVTNKNFFSIMQSPRKPGYLGEEVHRVEYSLDDEAPEDNGDRKEEPTSSKFKAGLKRVELSLIPSPLVSHSILLRKKNNTSSNHDVNNNNVRVNFVEEPVGYFQGWKNKIAGSNDNFIHNI